jgi:PAS domain-containing protein
MSGIEHRRPDVPPPAARPSEKVRPPDDSTAPVEVRTDEVLTHTPLEEPIEQDAGQVAVTATPDGIVAIGSDGIIRFCNPAAATLLGRRIHDLIGAPVGFPITGHGTTEIDVVRPDGRASAVEIQITTTAWGKQLLYIAAMCDVTHRQHAVRTL